MSTVNQLSRSTQRSTASAGSSARSHEQDETDTREYLRLIASLHEEWDRLESQASTSVMPQRHLMDAVIAETRHGAQVQMPATDLGPYSMSEFSLRALIRRTVDSVPGARALRSPSNTGPRMETTVGWGFRRPSPAGSPPTSAWTACRSSPSGSATPFEEPAMRT